jgi:hypothetical protein
MASRTHFALDLAYSRYRERMDEVELGHLRVKLGSVAFLAAAGSGYGIGLDAAGRRIEFIGDWRALAELEARLANEVVYIDVEGWQVIAVNEEIRLDLGRQAMAERAAFLRSALAKLGG